MATLPNTIQAIIDKTDNTWQGFSFLFAICPASSLITSLAVDVPEGRLEEGRWAAEQPGTAYARPFSHFGVSQVTAQHCILDSTISFDLVQSSPIVV